MQIAGSGFKMSAKDFEVTLRDCPALEKTLQRFAHNMAMQATTIAACNRLHNVDQRLARWLLMSRDRIESDFVPLTQEYLSHMLGTRRASVTDAAGYLQKKKLITYARGEVSITNVDKLKRAACECYEAMNRQMRNWHDESK